MKTTRIRHLALPLTLALAALAVAQTSRADSLADRAPADAVGFVSWAGSDALGQSYDSSHLKGLLDALNLPQFISQKIDEEHNKDADPDKAADKKVAEDLIRSAVKSPSAFYFGPIDFANADQPKFKMAFYSKVGKEKAKALADQLFPIIERKKNDKDPVITATVAGDYLLIIIGSVPDMEKRFTGEPPADGLGSLAAYKKTMAQVAGDKAAASLYIDGEAALKLLDDGIAARGEMGADMWPKISDMIGLPALRHVAFAGNFDGPNWNSQIFIGLDAKRVGYMAFLDSKPLSDETLKLIPKDASWASVTRFDAARLMLDVKDGVARMDPQNGQRNFDSGMQQFFAFTNVDLQKDIIDQLDDAYVVYAVPDATGHSLKNAVLATKPKDANKLDDSLTTLESVISTMATRRNPNGVAFKTDYILPSPDDKIAVHIITTPAIAPAWTVRNGVLYFSLSPEGIKDAVANADKKAFIPENPQFAELWKKVGNKQMSGFTFIDYSKVAAEFYPLAEKALATHKADHPNEKNPFTLPPLDKITANLTPAMSVYWSDADGFHTKSTGPAPLLDMVRGESLLQFFIMGDIYTHAPAMPEKNMP